MKRRRFFQALAAAPFVGCLFKAGAEGSERKDTLSDLEHPHMVVMEFGTNELLCKDLNLITRTFPGPKREWSVHTVNEQVSRLFGVTCDKGDRARMAESLRGTPEGMSVDHTGEFGTHKMEMVLKRYRRFRRGGLELEIRRRSVVLEVALRKTAM